MKKNNKGIKRSLKIIDKVESIRAKNNKNWMNMLKIAFKFAPKHASKIMNQINSDDKKISKLLRKLGEKRILVWSILMILLMFYKVYSNTLQPPRLDIRPLTYKTNIMICI